MATYHPSQNSIQVRLTRHAGHCWRSRDKLISNILLWTTSHGWAKAGRPARTYIKQLCTDTGCSFGDLLRAMNDREGWQERVREICADGKIWWWWWLLDPPTHTLTLEFLKIVLQNLFRITWIKSQTFRLLTNFWKKLFIWFLVLSFHLKLGLEIFLIQSLSLDTFSSKMMKIDNECFFVV